MKAFLIFFFFPLFAETGYLPPESETPLIRRDLIPLAPDTLEKLGTHLATLAARPAQSSPQDLRASAQLLALASRLHPTDQSIKTTNSQLKKRSPITAPKKAPDSAEEPLKKRRSEALNNAWHLVDYLLADTENPDSQKLAHLLLAPLTHLSPYYPSAKLHQPELSARYWKDTVAPIEQFILAANHNTDAPKKPLHPDKPAEPVEPVKPPPFYRSEEAILPICYFTYRQGESPSPSPRPHIGNFKLSVKPITEGETEGKPFLKYLPPVNNSSTQTTIDTVRKYFQKRGKPLPKNHTFTLQNLNDPQHQLRVLAKNSDNLSGALIPMIDSLIEGENLAPDTLLLARISLEGAIFDPYEAWQLLQYLAQNVENKRIIIPPSLAEHLLSLAILRSPKFLFKNEFIAAQTYQEARHHLFTPATPHTGHQTAHQAWKEVVTKKPRSITHKKYLSKKGVRSKLSEAIHASPRHYSAKILYKFHSSGESPRLSHKMGAVALHDIAEPLSQLFPTQQNKNNNNEKQPDSPEQIAALNKKIETLSLRLKHIEQFIQFDQRSLIQDTEELLKQAHKIQRATKANRNSQKYRAEYQTQHFILLHHLRVIAGYREPAPPPTKQTPPQ